MKFDHIPKFEPGFEPEFEYFIIKLSLSRKPTLFLYSFKDETLFIPIVEHRIFTEIFATNTDSNYFKVKNGIFATDTDSNYFKVEDGIFKLDLINGLFRLFEILLSRFNYFKISIKSKSITNTSLQILVEKFKLKDTDPETKTVTYTDTNIYTIFYTREREIRKIGGITKKTICMIDLNFFRNFMNKLYNKLNDLSIIRDTFDFLLNSENFEKNAELSIDTYSLKK